MGEVSTPVSSPAYQISLQFAHRQSKRKKIEHLFRTNIGHRFSSAWLHAQFGSSFRARASEVNLDANSEIVIRNAFYFDREEGAEISTSWSELRPRHLDLG
jgi:hypothetical protein